MDVRIRDGRAGYAPANGRRSAAGGLWYWLLVAVLLVVGVVGIFSVGLPLLLTGLVLAALAPVRREPAAFWPPLAGTFAFFFGYILLAPLGCVTGVETAWEPALTLAAGAPSAQPPIEEAVCTNLLGLDYSGSGHYDPPLLPAVFGGMLIGGATSLATRALLRRKLPGSSAG